MSLFKKTVQVDINADTKGFQKGLKTVDTGLTKMKGGISSLAKAGLGLAGISAGIAGIAQSLKAYVSLESSVMRINDLFGDAAKYITYFAQNTSKNFGMAEASAYQYAATYGNLFKNITADSAENAKVTIAMLSASGVIASKTGRTMEDVADRIRSGLLGSTEAIEDLGINVNVAMLEMSDAFKTISDGRSWAKLTFYEQQQIRTLAILEQAHSNFGDEVQKGSAYSLSTLKSSLSDLAASAGQFVNAFIQPIVKGLTQIVQWANAALKSLASVVGLKMGSDSGEGIKNAVGAQEDLTDETKATVKAQSKLAGFDEFNDITKTAGIGATDTGAAGGSSVFDGLTTPAFEAPEMKTSKLKSSIASLMKYVKESFSPSFEAWNTATVALAEPIEFAYQTISTSTGELVEETLKPLGAYVLDDFVPTITNAFSENFAPMFSDVLGVVIEEFSNNYSFMCDNVARFTKDMLLPTFEGIKTVALDVFNAIGAEWGNRKEALISGFKGFQESVRAIWTSLYDNVFKPVFDKIGAIAGELWEKHLKGLWENIVYFVGSISEFIMTLWNEALGPLVTWLIDTLGPTVSNVLGAVGEVFGTVFGVISDVVGGIFKALGGLLDFLTGIFSGDWEKAWTGIKNFFGGIWDAIWGIVKGVVNLIIDGINLLWTGIYAVVSGIVNAIGGIAGALGDLFGQDWHFSMPSEPPLIPKLASGGLAYGEVTALIGDNFNARQDPEVIAPLSSLKGMILEALMQKEIATGSSGETRIILQLENGETLADMLIDPMNNKAKNLGYAPVFAPA